MTCGGEKACLANISVFGGQLRLLKFLVDPCQFRCALGNALFKGFVGLFECHVGSNPLGDVGIGCHDAAVGHRVRSDFDDPLVGTDG